MEPDDGLGLEEPDDGLGGLFREGPDGGDPDEERAELRECGTVIVNYFPYI